jgi:hypothetical protein
VEDCTHKLRTEGSTRVTSEIFASAIFSDRDAAGLPPINPDMITYSNGAALVVVPLQLQLSYCHEDKGANGQGRADGNKRIFSELGTTFNGVATALGGGVETSLSSN